MSLKEDGFVSFKKIEEFNSTNKRIIKRMDRKLKEVDVILSDKVIVGVVEEGF